MSDTLVGLFDFRANLDSAIQQLSDSLVRCARDLRKGPIWGQERDRNLDSIRDIVRQLGHWVEAAHNVSELNLAQDHDDLPSEQSENPEIIRSNPERLSAVESLVEVVSYSSNILEELKEIRDTPGRLIDLYRSGKLKYFGPNAEGEPDIRSMVEYDLVSLESDAGGWEFIDAECASLLAQNRAIWAQYRKIRDEEVLPRHRAEMKTLRET